MGWKTRSLALASLILLATACSPQPPRDAVVEIPCEQFSAEAGDQVRITRSVSVKDGGHVVVRLCTNPSTGFAWEDVDISTPAVLAERSREFIPPGVTMPGSAGLEQWTFEAVGHGTCTVALGYSRPWEGGEKDIWLFELEVTVE